MWTAHAGEIDRVEGQSLQTRYFFFVGPVVPLRSVWVTDQSVTHHGAGSVMHTTGIPVRLQWRSVLLGYARIWSFLAAAIYPFATHWGEPVHFGWESPWIEALGLFVSGLALTFGTGRLSAAERARRRALLVATGLGVDPAVLPAEERDTVRVRLEEQLRREGVPFDPDDLAAYVARAPGHAPYAYALARYAAPDDARWAPLVARFWAAIEPGRFDKPLSGRFRP